MCGDQQLADFATLPIQVSASGSGKTAREQTTVRRKYKTIPNGITTRGSKPLPQSLLCVIMRHAQPSGDLLLANFDLTQQNKLLNKAVNVSKMDLKKDGHSSDPRRIETVRA